MTGNTTGDIQENTTVKRGTSDRELTFGNPDSSSTVNENAVKLKTLERWFNGRIDRERSSIADMVEVRIQNSILIKTDSIVVPKNEFAIISNLPSSGRSNNSVAANFERGEHSGILAPFENVS